MSEKPRTPDDILQEMAIVGAKEFVGTTHPNEDNVRIDPFTIIMLASLIVSVIKMIQSCREKQDGEDIHHLTSFELTSQHNRLLQRAIRQNVGWWKWLRYRKHYTNALIKVGRSSKPENIDKILADTPRYISF